ncbi:L,D-transpeptidase family protein [Novosphingobium terrae]|uniref:L,D-transpeptidase family protein n=1 Tax=Novosphingobium terrae TaxID=2726189 RepID=UPI001F12DA37|nr:L,D-transpeptidase family protein [Novosphingobium terrae]
MVTIAAIPQAKRLPAMIAVAASAALLAAVGLIKLDEHLGTAHLSRQAPTVALPASRPVSMKERPDAAPEADPSYAPAFEAEGGNKPAPAQATPATDTLVIKHTLTVTEPIKYGQWFWNEDGAPAGAPIVITVDLNARVLSVFRGGYEIGTTAVLLGTQEKPTPLGVFPITQKDAHHMSNLYDAPMPYMMRLTNDGVSIHATNVQNGYASHGCVGVPLPFAQKVFGVTKLGDKVIITRGQQGA